MLVSGWHDLDAQAPAAGLAGNLQHHLPETAAKVKKHILGDELEVLN